MDLPSISIVVPSFNQAQYLGETLQSLVDQQYPALEVIIQEGGSTDGSIALAQDYSQRHPGLFRLFVEKDAGQADALNRGFARAGGQILGFLNSDDTLLPGTLARVAQEIDPARGRHVVMGRCVFTGSGSRYVGVEHPAEWTSHFEMLAIWKRGYNTIPQPSVFWHRSVWERCGSFDVNEHHALDYDLFCRFSRHYPFHRVDALWSTYRMHDASKSAQRTEQEVLALSIQVSRKHWGPWSAPLRWRCELSYFLYRLHRHEHARHHARRAEQALRGGRVGAALLELGATALYSPRMAAVRLVGGWIKRQEPRIAARALNATQPAVRYADGWIGPLFREQLVVPASAERVILSFRHEPMARALRRQQVTLLVDGVPVDTMAMNQACDFVLAADVTPFRGSSILVEVQCRRWFVPQQSLGSNDRRRLSVVLRGTAFEG